MIARFAYADLLKQAGQPTLLILDDALVHSDSGKHEGRSAGVCSRFIEIEQVHKRKAAE